MPETKVRQHQWVKITFCPVEVLDDGHGNPVVVVDPDKHEAAEDNARYGCFACDAPLEENMVTPCAGRADLIT